MPAFSDIAPAVVLAVFIALVARNLWLMHRTGKAAAAVLARTHYADRRDTPIIYWSVFGAHVALLALALAGAAQLAAAWLM